MAVKNRQKQPTYEDYALATTPTEDVIHGAPTLTYDYSQLEAPLAALAQDKARNIKRAERRSVENMIQIGRDLIELQANFPHGLFLPWIAEEFGWSKALAYKLINLAKHYPTSAKVPTIGLTALYQLTSTNTPASALEEATARADAGETITVATASTIAAQHKRTATKAETATADKAGYTPPPKQVGQPIEGEPSPLPARGKQTPTIQYLRQALGHLHDARNNAHETELERVNAIITHLLRAITDFERGN